MSYVKFPPPRPLTRKETLDTLDHWRSQFRTFFKRDKTFYPFLSTSLKWDPLQTNFGFTNVTNGEGDVYEASDRAEDFTDLLNVLSGFLPHSYLTARISQDTKCWQDVWDIIYQHYNCKISSDTLLDFENLKKESDENYLQYYERLLQHTRLHLAPANAEVGTLINNKMDCLTISLMNMVAMNWLRKIDPNLIQIIRTEYSTKLKSGTQLAQLVPTIAPNVDNLLSRYSNSSVSKVTSGAQEALEEEQDDEDEDTSVRLSQTTTRYRGRGQASFSGRPSLPPSGGRQWRRPDEWCGGGGGPNHKLANTGNFKREKQRLVVQSL